MTADFVLFTNPWHDMMFINSSGVKIPDTELYGSFQILYLKLENVVYFVDN